MKYVINSSDINDVYSFFIPIVLFLWKERGYSPVTILVGDRDTWLKSPKNKCVLDFCEQAGEKIIFVKPIPNYKTSSVAQVSRLFACADPSLKQDDYILTSDADMLPLSRTWFNAYDKSKTFNFFGGNAYLGYIGNASPTTLPSRFPMCYIGANVSNWRSVMGISKLEIQTSMEQALRENEAAGVYDHWNLDEDLFCSKMFKSPLLAQSQFINRNWSGGRASQRLDRENWNFNNQRDFVDCHFLRPGYKYLKELRQVLMPEIYCYPGHIKKINEYITAFMA